MIRTGYRRRLPRQAGTRFGGAGNGGRQIQKRKHPTARFGWMLSFCYLVSGEVRRERRFYGDVPGKCRAAPATSAHACRLSARRKPKNPAIPEPQSRTSAAPAAFFVVRVHRRAPRRRIPASRVPRRQAGRFCQSSVVSQTPADQTACKYPPRPSRSVRRPDAIPGSDTRQSGKDPPAPRQRYAPPFR